MSHCDFIFIQAVGEKYLFRCANCEQEVRGRNRDRPPKAKCNSPYAKPDSPRPLLSSPSVGTELTAIFTELGIKPKASCGCKAKAAAMDSWGVAGCKERRAEILTWMQEAYEGISWNEWLATGYKLMGKQWFNPLAPFGSILDEAIRRAEQRQSAIKVVFLTPGLSCGGAERWILSLCQNFDPLKIWVQAIGVEGGAWIDPMMKEQVPKHVRLVDGWDAILPYAQAADMLIVWGSPGMIDLAKASGEPFIVVIHGADAQSSYGGTIARKGIEAGGISACVNEACLACYPEEYRGQVTVIPNGADEERVKSRNGRGWSREGLWMALSGNEPSLPKGWPDNEEQVSGKMWKEIEGKYAQWNREAIEWSKKSKILLYLGRVMKDKHIDKLRAVAEALPPEWVTVAAGNTDSFGREQIGGRLQLIAQRNHVGDLLAAADAQILLSPSEAHPLSITEGWLAGVPTVVSELPWIKSIHRQHGPMSWLVPLDATAEETAAIVLEADAAGRGSEQVLHAQEVARLEFTAKRMSERWERFIIGLPSRDS